MLKKINPTETESWNRVKDHFSDMKGVHMKTLFESDPKRFDRFSIRFNDIFLDYSKNIVTEETMRLLIDLARDVGLEQAIEKMFNGERINETEDRPVLHVALRNRKDTPIFVDGKEVMDDVNGVLLKMKRFSEKVITGEWKGYTGKQMTDIVNIGIGGSDLGPVMATECLKPYQKPGISTHFVSNIEARTSLRP
jgi:glucose-6-phosphate isomerase